MDICEQTKLMRVPHTAVTSGLTHQRHANGTLTPSTPRKGKMTPAVAPDGKVMVLGVVMLKVDEWGND